MRRVNVAVRRSAAPVTVNDDEVKKQRREDSHFYLWVTIGIWKIPATGAAASGDFRCPRPILE